MNRILKMRPIASALLVATTSLAGTAPVLAGQEFDEAEVIVEINASDGDVGFHVLLDAPAWSVTRIIDPDGEKIFQVKAAPGSRLEEQGLTENFFESAEPVCSEEDVEEEGDRVVTLEDFVMRFPAGEYTFKGKTIDGLQLKSVAELTYDLPAAPDIELTEEMAFEFDPAAPADTPIMLMWEPGEDLGEGCHDDDLVTGGYISDPAEVEVVNWEIALEPADDEAVDPERTVTVQLRGDQDTLTVPPEYLASLWDDASEDGVLFVKFEIGAIEESGNRTFSEGEFCLYEDAEDDCVFEDD